MLYVVTDFTRRESSILSFSLIFYYCYCYCSVIVIGFFSWGLWIAGQKCAMLIDFFFYDTLTVTLLGQFDYSIVVNNYDFICL